MKLSRKIAATLAVLVAAVPPVIAREGERRSGAESERGVIATVNGDPIYFEALERYLGELHQGAAEAERRAPDMVRALFRLVNDALLAQEARALGMHEEEPIPSRVATRRENRAVKRLEQEEIWSRAEPGEDEVERAFQEEYRTITFRMLTSHEREQAEALRAELDAGADFAELAVERSVDPYGPRGGLVENLPRIDMPHELADQAFAASPGELQGPLPTRIGWSILRVESAAQADPERREELLPSVRKLVRYRKAEAQRGELAPRLREAHPVVVDEALLAAIVPERLPDARLVPTIASPEAVVARIGRREIRAERLGRALRLRWKGVRNAEAATAARGLVLERMIREELMRAEALARGYGDTAEMRRALRVYETGLLVPRFLNEVVGAGLEATREEMERYYEENKQRYHRPPKLQLRQITVADEQEAERLGGLLRQGADPAWLARQHSSDRYRDSGGDRGWISAGPSAWPFEELLDRAQSGDVLGPVAVPDGFVIARVITREERGIYAFDEISGNVRRAVRDQKAQQAIHEFIQIARSRSEIVIYEEVLAEMRITGSYFEEDHDPQAASGPGAREH